MDIRHVHTGLRHCSIHYLVCPTLQNPANFTRGLTFVYRRRGLKSRASLAIFILIILSFTAATIYWAVWTASYVTDIRWVLLKNVGMDLSEKFALANAANITPGLMEMYLEPFMVSYP